MSVAAWDGFLNDQSNWPAASRIGNATGATTARDTLGDKTFVKRKRMSQEERHLQILQAAVKIIATKGFWGMSLQNISDELGITEAAIFGINLRFVKPFIAALIGGAVGGAWVVSMHVYMTAVGLTAIPGMAIVQASSLLNYIIGMVIAFGVAFVVSLVLKYKTDAE